MGILNYNNSRVDKLRGLISNVNSSEFKVTMSISSGPNNDKKFLVPVGIAEELDFLCKEVSVPTLKTNTTDWWWKGVKYPIKREVQPEGTLDMVFYESNQSKHRNALFNWMIHDVKSDSSIKVHTNGIEYSFYNVVPISISEIKLASDKGTEIPEYTVIMAYSYFTSKLSTEHLSSNIVHKEK